MPKILVVGIGGSQGNVIEKLQHTLPDCRCVLIDTDLYSTIDNIDFYSLSANSSLARKIIDMRMMPGTTNCEITKHLPDIIEEQKVNLIEFLGFAPIAKKK